MAYENKVEVRTKPSGSEGRRFPLARRFLRTARGFWWGGSASRAWTLTAALIGGALLQLLLQFRLNYWNRDFFDAFGHRDGPALRAQVLLFAVFAVCSMMLAVLAVWSRMTMQREWRAWLTRRLLDRWLAREHFHRLRFPDGEDRNPEFRIAEDARVATDSPVSMAVGLLSAVLNVCIFIGILWNVGGDLSFMLFGHALTVPRYLVLTVLLYSAILTLSMTLIGRPMVPAIASKNAAEAQFRAVAARLREDGEAGGPGDDMTTPHGVVTEAFATVIERWRTLCAEFMRITVVVHGNGLVAPIVAWILCAPRYLEGALTLGEAAQAVAAFVTVQASLNWLVENYGAVAECLSSVNRVGLLLLTLDESLEGEPPGEKCQGEKCRREKCQGEKCQGEKPWL